jgi:aryl-alcohol dehydrogenase-like predicted oxidoreductase
MEYTKLGRTGLDVSRICLGCMSYGGGNQGNHAWSLGEEESRPFIKRALEAGINFFDTANRYSLGNSEEILGRAIKDFARRDEVVIATKVYGRMRPARTAPGCRARRSSPRSTPACTGSAWITSISTKSTASTTTRRSRRRSKRCTTS